MKRIALCIGLGLLSAQICATEFRSMTNATVMFDAPSARGNKLHIAPRGAPVEIISSLGEWIKVRDFAGDLTWVEKKALSERRMLVVAAPQVAVLSAAREGASAVFSSERGVMLEMAEPINFGWVKVRHAGGLSGFVKISEVWGL